MASTGAGARGLTGGVDVAADGVRHLTAHGLALAFDPDDGPIERGELRAHEAIGRCMVDFIAVAAQGNDHKSGDPALLAPQKRAPQQCGRGWD